MQQYLKTTVGKMSRIFFHPTNHITNKLIANMHLAGIDHKHEFAKKVQEFSYTRWPKGINVEWMKLEKWKYLWEVKYNINIKEELVELLRKSQNNQ
eukprot:2859940-Ditylum_brightwellii.AAC.1